MVGANDVVVNLLLDHYDAGQELAARVTAETLLSGRLLPPVIVASGG